MSHQVIWSDNNKDRTPEDCLQSYQYVWMSHWSQTRVRSVNHVHNQLSNCYESGEDSHRNMLDSSLAGPEIDPQSSKFVKEFRETNKVLVPESSTRSCNILRPDTLKSKKHFPMFKSSQYTEGNLSLKIGESSRQQEGISKSKIGPISVYDASHGPIDKSLPSMLERTRNMPEIQLTESLFHPEGIALIPQKNANSGREVMSSHAKDELLGSTSADVMLEFKSSRTPVESFSPRQDQINQTSSSFLVREEKMGKNMALSTRDPETSNCHREFLGQQFHNLTTYVLPPIRPTRLYSGLSELPRNTTSLHGKETMKICTAVDYGGPSKFSQTTHRIFIKENTNVNLSGGVQILKESISTNFEREPPSKVLSFSPGYGFNLKQGVKLQSLDSSTESEGKEKVENVHCEVDLKNESSAETDTMDMDTLQKNCLIEVAPSVANKGIDEVVKSPTYEGALNSVKAKRRGRSPNIALPDINLALPPISSTAGSTDNGDTSSSRTQSMDASEFLSHAQHPTNLKFSICPNGPLELDPCSRWVKRLKPSSSVGVALGTKSSKMVEPASHEKVNKLFNKMLYFGRSGSEQKMSKSFGEEHVVMDQGADLRGNVESSSVGSVKAGQDKTLSNAWIQRWCHNPISSLQKQTALAAHEPLSSKATKHNIHSKQYPSIAAMALMGKAMGGFRPCELRKEGSFMAWNT